MAEFLGHFAITSVHNSMNGIFIYHLGKMDHIKIIAILVSERTKPHIGVVFCGAEPAAGVLQYRIIKFRCYGSRHLYRFYIALKNR